MADQTNAVQEEEVKKVERWASFPKDNLPSIEKLLVDIHNKNLNDIRVKTMQEYAEVSKRQEEVSFLHSLISAINSITDAEGKVDFEGKEDLIEMFNKAKEMGIKVPAFDKNKMTNDQRNQFISSIRDTVKDENTLIELHMQKISNLNYELHESYQWMRSHTKTLDDVKRKIANRIDLQR